MALQTGRRSPASPRSRASGVSLARHGGLFPTIRGGVTLAGGRRPTHDPRKLVLWSEFHRRVEDLPADEREAVDLLWYQELSQEEAAEVLGVDKSTVKRRWRSARLKLADALKDKLPGF